MNNSGAGSLRDAVSQANRIIVFNVSGVIDLNKEVLVFKDNQTVLFQTAPGDGIELYNGRTSSTNANNLIVRYMRMRTGRQVSGSDNIDAGGAAYGHDQFMIIVLSHGEQMNVFHSIMTSNRKVSIT